MQPLPTLFALRTALAVPLAFVVVGFLLWCVVRVAIDAITWFREEFTDEYRDLRRESREAKARRAAATPQDSDDSPPPGQVECPKETNDA